MNRLQRLPNEIILFILMNLDDKQDIFAFVSTCHLYHNLISQEPFWRDFIIRKFNIKYCSPSQSWYHLLLSGDVNKMCPHITPSHLYSVFDKQSLLWQSFCTPISELCCKNLQFDNYGLCMELQCEYVGCGDVFFEPKESYPGHLRNHHVFCGHNIMLKLSPLNFMEIWCYSCNSPVGFWGFPKMDKPQSEKFIVREILKYMTQLPSTHYPAERMQVIERRRLIEQRLSVFQHNHDYTYLIEKNWFMSWIDFLVGKSNDLPTGLDNSKLFVDRKLRHDLIIGVDYELVGSSVRTYIERMYGLENNSIIVSGDDFIGQPLYRSISQSVLLHRKFAITNNNMI